MRHETALRKLDELDAGEAPGLGLRMHLASCPGCARAARLTAEALKAYRAAPAASGDDRLEERVMAEVRLTAPPRQDFALRDWLFPAAVIVASLCALPLGEGLQPIASLLGPGYTASIALVLGIALTAYAAFFVATHLSELVDFLEKKGVSLR